MTDQMQSVDDLLDAHAPTEGADVDSLLDQHAPGKAGPFYPGVDARLPKTPPIQPMANTSEQFNQWFKGTPDGRITDAVIGGAKTGWEGMALSQESEDFFKKLGWFNDPKKPSYMGSFNDAFMRPAVIAANTALRAGGAAFSAVQSGIAQVGQELDQGTGNRLGLSQLGRDVAGGLEMTMGFHIPMYHPIPAKFWSDALKAKAIGGDDAVYFGLKEPVPLSDGALADDLKSSIKPLEEQTAETGTAETAAQATSVPAETLAPAPDIHAVAREIAPDTFKQYDDLVSRRDTYRRWLSELSDTRDEAHANREDVKSINGEIETILGKVNGVEDRLTKKASGRLSDLRDQLDEIESTAKQDSPDMARIRRVLQENDYKMRDLAPDVTRAYREAQERMPEQAPETATPETEQAVDEARAQGREEGETETAQPVDETAKPVETKPGEPVAESVKPDDTAPKTEMPVEQQKAEIASRVARQLEDAGRPREEAEAAAQLIAARYETRAARMGGKLGSPLELFNRDGATILAGQERARAGGRVKEFAQGERPTKEDVSNVSNEIAEKHNLKNLQMSLDSQGNLNLNMIEVPKDQRNMGIGKSAMQNILDYADQHGLKVTLSPDVANAVRGTTSRGRLVNFYKAFGFVENKGRAKDFSISDSMYREPATKEFDQSGLDRTDTPEFKNWFKQSAVVDQDGAPKPVYRGDWRGDLLGDKLKVSKASSGRFYFTENPDLASSYAEGKHYIPDEKSEYGSWFEFPDKKYPRERNAPTLDNVWYRLTSEEKEKVKDTLLRAAMDDQNNIVFHDEPDGGINSRQNWEWQVKQARGNWLEAAKEIWLNSGALFDMESEFSKVLREAGLKHEFDNPHEAAPTVTPVYLSIQKPVNTSAIDEAFIDRLSNELKGDRSRAKSNSTDIWDKETRTPKEWLAELKADFEKSGSDVSESHVWTSVPENVTKALQRMGYDGIQDTGGKNGGPGHQVWIAFEPNQVKSIHNRGTWSTTNDRMLAQAKRGAIQFKDNQAIIKLFKGADASTFIHETGHKFLEEILADAAHESAPVQVRADADTVRKWLGVGDGEAIPTKAHEKFARGFERYLMEGRAPSQALARVFAQFKQWLTKIYETVTRLKSPINDDIRDVFDKLLSINPEKVTIAPDRALGADFATLHEGDAEHTPGNQAKVVGDRVRDERHAVADEHASEISDELQPGRVGNGSGEGAARSESADGGVNATGPDAGKNGVIQESGTVGAGGSQAPVEGIGPPQEPKLKFGPSPKQKLYTKVPPRPKSLVDFVRAYGGIKNDRGDIKGLFGGKGTGGVLRKTGKDIDRVAQAAEEAGYFPELGGERPEINQFIDKLTRDVNGDHQFSDKDYDEVVAYKDALNRNAEVDRLASELSIRQEGMTYGEFWDEVANRMSVEEQLKEINSQYADFERELRHAEEWAKEHAESKGDAWEGDDIPDYEKTRSEEDLENEYRAEEAARGAIKGADDGGESGSAGGSAGDVQESGGSRGRGPGFDGGARKTEIPNGPNERFPSDETNLVDKAGNIRLDNLNTPEDVNEVLHQTAAENNDFIDARRGVISAGEQLDLADALGMTASKLNWRRIGDAFNAEQILAARKLLIQSATEVRDLMAKAATGSDADVLAYAEARQRHLMIQENVAGITAEAGRALGAFRRLEGQANAEMLSQFFQSTIGRTPEQLRQEAQFGMNLQTAAQVSLFVNGAARGTFRNAILEYYVNALISGPITHARYSVGNALNALARPLVEIPMAAAVGATREALGYEVKDRVYLGEAGAQLYGMLKGSADGLGAAVEAFKTGISPALPGEKVSGHFTDMNTRAIPGKVGEVINVPSKSVAAIHSFFKALRYEQNIQSLAYRTAMNEGLTGDAFKGRIAELTQKPTPEMMISASADAMKELFMAPTDYNSFSGKLTAAANSNLAAKIIVPFMKIGTQITREAFVERSPIGLLDKNVRSNLMGENGGAAKDMQFGKIATGTALIGTSVLMTLNGLMTGDGPSDPDERRVWLLAHKPNHISIGDISVGYDRLGPFAMLMRFGANMTEAAHGWDGEDGTVLAKAGFEGFNKAVLDETFMKGLSDMLNAVFHPEEYGESYIRGMVTNWMPFSVGLSQTAHAVDPYQREAKTILDAARAKVPWASMGLLPKRDMFGEPIAQGGQVDRYKNDPVVKEMDSLGMGIGKLGKSIRGQELTPEQYDQYAQTAGRLAKMRLNALVQNPGWQQIPRNIRVETIHKTINSSRTAAANMIAAQSVGGPNDIIKGAIDDKMRARNGE